MRPPALVFSPVINRLLNCHEKYSKELANYSINSSCGRSRQSAALLYHLPRLSQPCPTGANPQARPRLSSSTVWRGPAIASLAALETWGLRAPGARDGNWGVAFLAQFLHTFPSTPVPGLASPCYAWIHPRTGVPPLSLPSARPAGTCWVPN